jgi:hypothetical protein
VKAVLLASGWILFGVAALLAVAMHRADRRMQTFRTPGAPSSAFTFVPLRWRSELYTKEGQPLVRRAWGLMVLMYVVAGLGVVLLSLGVEALP